MLSAVDLEVEHEHPHAEEDHRGQQDRLKDFADGARGGFAGVRRLVVGQGWSIAIPGERRGSEPAV